MKDKIVEILVFGFSPIILALIINYFYPVLGFYKILLSALFILIIVIINIYFLSKLAKNLYDEQLKEKILLLENLMINKKHPWLKHCNEIDSIESTTNGREIWVVSPNLAEEQSFSELIKNNTERGIYYRYIVPDIELISGKEEELKSVFGSSNFFTINKIKENQFKLLTLTDIVIYNPYAENGNRSRVFWQLPVEKEDSTDTWLIEMSRHNSLIFVGRIKELLKNNGYESEIKND